MSESAKKLVQARLPFAIVGSDKYPTNSSPKAEPKASPKVVSSRKRKPSSDGDIPVAKVGRANSKENISAKEVVEIFSDSEGDDREDDTEKSLAKNPKEAETTPVASGGEVLHIKLSSGTRSNRKINMDKPQHQKSIEEEEQDDSVVYLDSEDVRKSSKKSRKRKAKKESSENTSRARRSLKMTVPEETEVIAVSSSDEKVYDGAESNEKHDQNSDDDLLEEIVITKEIVDPEEKDEPLLVEIKTIQNVPSTATTPQPEDPDVIHEEIAELLSDDSDTNKIESSPDKDDVGKTPTSSKMDIKNMTPKQLARRQEQEARRLEKELQRQKERDLKEQQRLKEKEQREEAKRKEKEEKEEARKREKEERDRKKQAEQDKKDEEKRQKEEERKRAADQREEEKRQKEEERKRQVEQREEEKRKRDEAQKKKELEEESRKKRAAEAFSKFFVAKKKKEASIADNESKESKESAENGEASGAFKSNFMPFQIGKRMKSAPCVRLQIGKDQLKILDENLNAMKPLRELYLSGLKNASYKPGSSPNTWPLEDKDDDVAIIEELEDIGEDIATDESNKKMKQRAKYLMFAENRRPAFHGTWRKKTPNISARRPFAQDPNFFDYEVDSDEEWEEEEPGESLHGSDSEKEKEAEEDDYEVDNDFFVPHGHLSDEEMQEVDEEDNHPETQKAKLKILQQEFAAEMKKKTEKIKPRLIGCVWMNGDEDENGCSKTGSADKKYHCSDIIWRILKAREMMTSEEGVKLEFDLEPEVAEADDESEKPTQLKAPVRAKFNDASLKDLLKLIHGNTNGKKFIIKEFQAYRLKNFHKDKDFQEFSIKSVDEKMMEISEHKTCPEEGPLFSKKCWLVKPIVLQEYYGEDKLPLPNEWTYILEKEVKKKKPLQSSEVRKEETEEKAQLEAQQKLNEEKMIASSSITAKKKSECNVSIEKSQTPSTNDGKKRVKLLMSVPRGQEISLSKKNNLISQYLKDKQQEAAADKSKVGEGVIVID